MQVDLVPNHLIDKYVKVILWPTIDPFVWRNSLNIQD